MHYLKNLAHQLMEEYGFVEKPSTLADGKEYGLLETPADGRV